MLQILGTLNRAFEHEIDKRKSNFRVQGMFFQHLYFVLTDINWYYMAYASLHKCDHINYKKFATWFFKKEGGGSKVVWNFSKNSFGLVAGPLIKIQPTQRNVLHTSLPLYELDIPFGTKNEPSSVEINILGMWTIEHIPVFKF